jgi:hypothetical protein
MHSEYSKSMCFCRVSCRVSKFKTRLFASQTHTSHRIHTSFLIHRRISVSRTYAHHSKKHSRARSRSRARGRRARCACRPGSSSCGACGACAAQASRPAVSTAHGTRTADPIHGRGMRGGCAVALGAGGAGSVLPRWAARERAVRGRQPPHALPRAGVGSHGVAWRGGTHPDARRLVEAADEDAVEVEVAQPPAAPDTSEKRPAGANAPTGG